jgi:transcription antitermination protein NusB
MPISPQKFREIAFQLIYSDDLGGDIDIEVIEMLMAQLSVTKRIVKEACEFKDKLLTKKSQIDEIISKHASSYEFDRIPRIERNIVRLGVYELLFSADLPPKVAIAEAMRLTRKFATLEASTFVNAVLDSVYQQTLIEKPHDLPLSGLPV